MVDPNVTTFQYRPEGLDAIGIYGAAHIFAVPVPHNFMWFWQVVIAVRLVRVHRRIRQDMLFQIALQFVLLRIVDGFRADFACGTIEDADDRPLSVNNPLPVSLGGVSIACLTAHIGLVNFNGSEHIPILSLSKCGTDAMTQVPGGFLGDPEIASQLCARNAY